MKQFPPGFKKFTQVALIIFLSSQNLISVVSTHALLRDNYSRGPLTADSILHPFIGSKFEFLSYTVPSLTTCEHLMTWTEKIRKIVDLTKASQTCQVGDGIVGYRRIHYVA